MKRFIASILLLGISSASCLAHKATHAAHAPDPDYSTALAAANRFLHAWQSEDHETGIVMLSDAARQHASPDLLQAFFSPGPNAAFEISRGTRVAQGQYAFPIVLFVNQSHPRDCKLVLVRERRDEWVVQQFPAR